VWSLREPSTEAADPHMAERLGAIYAWMTRQESARRSRRVRAGQARRKAAGLPVGRQPDSRDRLHSQRISRPALLSAVQLAGIPVVPVTRGVRWRLAAMTGRPRRAIVKA